MSRAADWLFSHPDDLDFAVAQVLGNSSGEGASGDKVVAEVDPLTQRGNNSAIYFSTWMFFLLRIQGKYRLLAIISHMGRNTECGHYVAHVKKEGKWVLFNDEKVSKLSNLHYIDFNCSWLVAI